MSCGYIYLLITVDPVFIKVINCLSLACSAHIFFCWFVLYITVQHRCGCYRFSAFWLRLKCLVFLSANIWYGPHWGPSILNWFLQLEENAEACFFSSWLRLVYSRNGPLPPLGPILKSPSLKILANYSPASPLPTSSNFFIVLVWLQREHCIIIIVWKSIYIRYGYK